MGSPYIESKQVNVKRLINYSVNITWDIATTVGYVIFILISGNALTDFDFIRIRNTILDGIRGSTTTLWSVET